MKKFLLSMSVFALVVTFAACGGAKSDGEKLGKKYCECQKLDGDQKKACRKEYKEMRKEMKAKYKDDEAAYKEFKAARKAAEKECRETANYDVNVNLDEYEPADYGYEEYENEMTDE